MIRGLLLTLLMLPAYLADFAYRQAGPLPVPAKAAPARAVKHSSVNVERTLPGLKVRTVVRFLL